MRSFCIITNTDKDRDLTLTNRISEMLTARGCRCTIWQADGKLEGEYHYTDPSAIPEDTECALVLGGDGTLLQAARDLVHEDIPLLGVNMGHLGFLAEVTAGNVSDAIDRLIEGKFEIEERMMLSGTVYREGRVQGKNIALNDVVIARDGHLRVVRFNNYVNDEFLNSYYADGIIIATPTGSTGYSLSAGGPVVSPRASMIIMTPVAPHTINARSVIFAPEDKVTVEIGPGRRGETENALVSFDGDNAFPMLSGDRVVIQRAAARTRILKLNRLSFVEVLRQKMENT
ncbi:MAG: NAD(+)/NADH kinase [Blautia sp.]|nr:NAD(+)/NADH kinase [Blautia sp.]